MITDILLRLKQTKSAMVSAKKMKAIASDYLSAHKKYMNEANRYIQDIKLKQNYKRDVLLFEEKANQSRTGRGRNKNNFRALQRLFKTNSYGSIIERKQAYMALVQQMGDLEALHILFYLGHSYQQIGNYQYAQRFLMEAFMNKRFSNIRQSSLFARIAMCCFEVMEYLNVSADKRLDILLRGARHLEDNSLKDIDWNHKYLQTIVIFHRMFCDHNGSKMHTIKQVENRLECLENKHPNNRFRKQLNISSRSSRYAHIVFCCF